MIGAHMGHIGSHWYTHCRTQSVIWCYVTLCCMVIGLHNFRIVSVTKRMKPAILCNNIIYSSYADTIYAELQFKHENSIHRNLND